MSKGGSGKDIGERIHQARVRAVHGSWDTLR
jgi:hypothetical protein